MQCCNKHRYTFGIIIGSIYVLGSLATFTLSACSYLEDRRLEVDTVSATEGMVASLVTTLISALFIFAIVKKHHNLIIPWLILCVALFFVSCFFIWILAFALAWINAKDDILLLIHFLGACVIGIEIATFYFSCWLYGKIRKDNAEKLSDVAVSYQTKRKDYITIS